MINNKSNYSILFVEDDIVALKNYSLALKESYQNVYEAKDGLTAYKIYKEKKPDIMIIDINIPKLNGIELLKKIRSTDLNTKTILLTSNSDTETLLDAASLKLTKYLVKPVSRKELFDALQIAIEEIKSFSVLSNKILSLKNNYYWDVNKHILYNKRDEVSLTKTEKDILSLIFKAGQNNDIVSYENIAFSLWDNYNEAVVSSLKTFVSTLRKKLPEGTILNVYGKGYKLGETN